MGSRSRDRRRKMGALNDARGQVKAGCRMGKSGSLSATPLPYGTSGPFSVAIPLLAALVLVNQQEAFRHRIDQVGHCRNCEGGRAKLRIRWPGCRLLAHTVDCRCGDVGEWDRGDVCPLGRLLAAGTGWRVYVPRNGRVRRLRTL